MNPSEGTTDNGHTYRVEWGEGRSPTTVIVDGQEQVVTGVTRYRGSGEYVECEAGTLLLAQMSGKPCNWTPS